MKPFIYIILFLLVSCTTSEEEVEVNETKDKMTLTKCLKYTYPELNTKIYEFLPTLYPECEDFKISYRSISRGQIDKAALFKNNTLKHYLNNFEEADESLLSQKFHFDKLKQCSNDKTYKEPNKCAFYVGGVFISDDRSLQLIRLYQEGEVEIFDVFIRIKNGEVQVLAIG